jgi:molecular chaperone GrpE
MTLSERRSEIRSEPLDVEHELPPPEEDVETVPATSRKEAQVEETTPSNELDKVKAERDALLQRLARAQAEFENARKRAAKEQQQFRDFALEDALRSLLPVLDSFDRALHAPVHQQDFRSGMELIRKQLHDTLTKLGIRPIPAQGEPFDPHLHEAIEMVDTNGSEDNQVVEELQRGYNLRDRLLRPSMVRVARNPKKKAA